MNLLSQYTDIQSLNWDLLESVGLRNHSCRRITITAKSVVAKITAANIVPHSLAPNAENENMLEQLEDNQDQDPESANHCNT